MIFLVGIVAIALFSGMDAVMKALVIAIGTYATMLWRNLVGLLLSGPIYALRRSGWPTRAALRLHLARGLLSTVMGFLFFWGIGRVPLAQGVALAFIAPLLALYLAAFLLHERIGGRTLAGSFVAFGGILLIFIGEARSDLGREALTGSIAVLASAICYALNIILMRRQSLAAEPAEIAFFTNLTVCAALLMALPFIGAAVPAAAHWPWLVFAAVLAISSSLLLSWAYARAPASYLATTEFSAFLWAALFGWLVFRETLAPLTLAGAALIVAGCILAARSPQEASPSLEAAAS